MVTEIKKIEKISIYPDEELLIKIRNFSKVSNYSMNKLLVMLLEKGIKDLEENGISSLFNLTSD